MVCLSVDTRMLIRLDIGYMHLRLNSGIIRVGFYKGSFHGGDTNSFR
jgi:hypothetical protein